VGGGGGGGGGGCNQLGITESRRTQLFYINKIFKGGKTPMNWWG